MQDAFDHLFVAPSSFDCSLAFYRDSLGSRVAFAWGGEGQPRGAHLTGGGVAIVIAEQHSAEDRSWSHGVNGRRPSLHLRVTDLDARFAQLPGTADVVVPPERTLWGTRWLVVRDPDDNLIAFEQALGASG